MKGARMTDIDRMIDADFLARAITQMATIPDMPQVSAAQVRFGITITPGRLGDTSPQLYTTSLSGVEALSLNQAEPARGTIVFNAGKGRFTASVNGLQGLAVYAECTGTAPDPAKSLRWDALVSEAGPVNGRLTIIPGTQLQYFATPPAGAVDWCRFTIDAMTGDVWPQDDRWHIDEVRLLAFAPA